MASDGSGIARDAMGWQRGVWRSMVAVYESEIDRRFAPVVEAVIRRADPRPGERVVDVGTGTGSAAIRAATLVAPDGFVVGVDVSTEMLAVGKRRSNELGLENVEFREGSAEEITAADGEFDVLLASLSLMYAIDRAAAARESARVLRSRGRVVASVWAGPDRCDIVRFQQTAGRFAPTPPVEGVGPGALADATPFLAQLAAAGIETRVETETFGFDFDNFDAAWDALAAVTTADLPPERRQEAKAAVREAMWPEASRPRHFRNETQFIVGERGGSP